MHERHVVQEARRAREFASFVAGAGGRLLHATTLLTAETPDANPRARRLLTTALAHTYAAWDTLRGEDPYEHARQQLALRFARGAWHQHRGDGHRHAQWPTRCFDAAIILAQTLRETAPHTLRATLRRIRRAARPAGTGGARAEDHGEPVRTPEGAPGGTAGSEPGGTSGMTGSEPGTSGSGGRVGSSPAGRSPEAAWTALSRRARRPAGVLHALTPQERLVLVLRMYEGVAEEQTAALLGLPAERVRAVCSRAMSTLLHPPPAATRSVPKVVPS